MNKNDLVVAVGVESAVGCEVTALGLVVEALRAEKKAILHFPQFSNGFENQLVLLKRIVPVASGSSEKGLKELLEAHLTVLLLSFAEEIVNLREGLATARRPVAPSKDDSKVTTLEEKIKTLGATVDQLKTDLSRMDRQMVALPRTVRAAVESATRSFKR